MASSGGRNTPYSTTAARTAPALVSRAARGDPLVAWPAGVGYSRASATASETAEQSFLSGKRGPQDGQDFGGGPGAGLLDALAPHSTTTAPHGTTPALAPRAVRASPLCAPPVARTPSQPRAAVTESKNSACGFFLAPRPVDGILYFSMKPVFLAAFRVDTDFNRDSSTDTVFSTAIQGGKAAQTAFRRRTVATTYTLQHNEGAKFGEPPASLSPMSPENTDNTSTVSLLHVVLFASHATPHFLLYKLRLY